MFLKTLSNRTGTFTIKNFYNLANTTHETFLNTSERPKFGHFDRIWQFWRIFLVFDKMLNLLYGQFSRSLANVRCSKTAKYWKIIKPSGHTGLRFFYQVSCSTKLKHDIKEHNTWVKSSNLDTRRYDHSMLQAILLHKTRSTR